MEGEVKEAMQSTILVSPVLSLVRINPDRALECAAWGLAIESGL